MSTQHTSLAAIQLALCHDTLHHALMLQVCKLQDVVKACRAPASVQSHVFGTIWVCF